MEYINLSNVQNPAQLEILFNAIVDELTALRTLLNEAKTDLSGHVHGGVTVDSGNTAAGAALTSPACVQKIKRLK